MRAAPAPRSRRWRLLAAALTVASVAAGCSPVPQPEPSPTISATSERGPVVLAVPDSSAATWTKLAERWNASHRNEPITVRALPDDATARHNELADAGRAGSGEFTVMAVDPTWIPEFAADQWLAKLPSGSFPTDGLQQTAVSLSTVDGQLYGYPVTADAGVLYYRKDLLAAAKVAVPKTWAELSRACSQIEAQLHGELSCYGVGLGTSESLTVATAEAVDSAGGQLMATASKPGFDGAQAARGVGALADAVQDGTIPSAALNWSDSDAAQAFLDGRTIFLRGWPTVWGRAQSTDGTSRVYGRVAVAPLVGVAGTGVSAFGGMTLSISSHARNQATADDVVRWLAGDEAQRLLVSEGSAGPALTTVSSDEALTKQYPWLGVVTAAVKGSRPLPVTVHYTDFSTAVQSAIAPVLAGKVEVSKALADLQNRLSELLK